MKTCKIDGCERQATSRGWCKNHYQPWYRAQVVKPPKTTSRAVLIEVMCEEPGSMHDLAARAGVSYHVTGQIIRAMHEAKEIHIVDWLPPVCKGSRWVSVFAFGKGRDKECPKHVKRDFNLKGRMSKYRERKSIQHGDPLVRALFAQPAAETVVTQ